MLETFRSTEIYKKLSFYGFIYSVISVIIYFSIPQGFGSLLIFIPFAFIHFAVGLLFISGIVAAGEDSHRVPINTDPIYDITFIIDFVVILGPLILFIIGCAFSLLGFYNK